MRRILEALACVALVGCTDTTPAPEQASAPAGAVRTSSSSPTATTPVPRRQAGAATGPAIISAEPASLEIGEIPTYGSGVGTVRLVNSGGAPAALVDCKSTCGCTAAECPKGTTIGPGESVEVAVRMKASSRPMRVAKRMTFWLDGHDPVVVQVASDWVSYVAADTWDLDPRSGPTGRLVLTAIDDAPFRITGVEPAVAATPGDEADVEHELTIDWATWRRLGRSRKIVFKTDHPRCPQVMVMVEKAPAE
jgi:hypothetical protein